MKLIRTFVILILFFLVYFPQKVLSDVSFTINDNCSSFLWWTNYRLKAQVSILEYDNTLDLNVVDQDIDKSCVKATADEIWYQKYDNVGWKVGAASGTLEFHGCNGNSCKYSYSASEYTNYWRIEACQARGNSDYTPPEDMLEQELSEEDIDGLIL